MYRLCAQWALIKGYVHSGPKLKTIDKVSLNLRLCTQCLNLRLCAQWVLIEDTGLSKSEFKTLCTVGLN